MKGSVGALARRAYAKPRIRPKIKTKRSNTWPSHSFAFVNKELCKILSREIDL